MSELLLARSAAQPGQCPVPPKGRRFMLVLAGSFALHAVAVAALTLYHNAISVEETACPVTNLLRVTLIRESPPAPTIKPAQLAAAKPATPARKPAPAKQAQPAPQQAATRALLQQATAQPAQLAEPTTAAPSTFTYAPAAAAAPATQNGSYPTAMATARTPVPYPPLARRRGYEGTVVLHLQLPPHGGRPQTLRIANSSGYDILDKTAASTVKNWSFAAPLSEGEQHAWHQLPVRFALTD